MSHNKRISKELIGNPLIKMPKPAVTATAARAATRSPADLLERITSNSNSPSHADIFQLQRTLGNRAVGNMLMQTTQTQPMIQPKLTVNAAGDKYEQEADRVAEQVMRIPAVQNVEERGKNQGPTIMTMPYVQRKGDGAFDVDDRFDCQLSANRGGGQPLPPDLNKEFEAKFAVDFSGVRIHTDAQADLLSRSIQAKAFTIGQDVFFTQGAYSPSSYSGKELIAHELTHVVQQNGTHESKDANTIEKIKTGNSNEQIVQRRFGFEIEVPIFFTQEPAGLPGMREDPGPTTAIDQGSFEVKVDHNEELSPLVSYANQNQNGDQQGFPHGPSIIELVSKPMDEFALTETDIKNRAADMADAAEDTFADINGGEFHIGGDYYVGSDSPRRTLQSTMGYFQTTYGIKLSSVPELFKQTAKQGKKNNPGNKAVVKQLQTSVKAGEKVVKALKPFRPNPPGPKVKQLATDQDLGKLNGYTVLLANYIRADEAMRGGVGLGKNLIGDYFYKTDLGTLAATLPASIQNILAVPAALTFFIAKLSEACDKAPTDDMLVGMTISAWITRVVGGGTDNYIQALKNPHSAIINSEQIGPGTNQEAGFVMENREPQNLDPLSKQKRKDMQREQDAFYTGPAKTQAELQDFLRDMTDPKKYPSNQWESVMLMIYRLLREINA